MLPTRNFSRPRTTASVVRGKPIAIDRICSTVTIDAIRSRQAFERLVESPPRTTEDKGGDMKRLAVAAAVAAMLALAGAAIAGTFGANGAATVAAIGAPQPDPNG